MTYRVGSSYGIHVYEGDRPVATFHAATEAVLFVDAMNAADAGDGSVEIKDLAGHTEQVPGQMFIYEEQHSPASPPLFALLEQVKPGEVIEMGGYRYTVGEHMSAGTTVMMNPIGEIVRYSRGDE